MRLTGRIVVRALAVMALALGGVCFLTYELVRVAERDDVDALVRSEASVLASAFAAEATDAAGLDGVLSGPEAERAARAALTIHPSANRHVATIMLAGRRLLANGGPPSVTSLARGGDAPPLEPGVLRSVDTSAGAIRLIDLPITDESGAQLATIRVLAPLQESRDIAVDALERTAVAGFVALGAGGALLALVVRRALRPMREVSTAASAITPTALSIRIPVPDSGDEVQQLACDLNDMLERIDEGDRTRRRYLAAISHEVRTPLAIAEGHLELLEAADVVDPSDVAATASTVRVELERLRRVLDDLMAVARGRDEVDITTGPIFLPDLFDSLASRVAGLGAGDRVTVAPAPAMAFTGDQGRIEQCVINLISNALDHNAPTTTVTVAARAEDPTIAIAVADDGAGIDPEFLPHVFEPFVTTRPAGTGRTAGLGLAVVDTLTRAQRGDVSLTTGPTGTTVTLRFPIDP